MSRDAAERFPRAVLIVGASVRAAATAAYRAGLVVDAIDLFADADLREVCRQVVLVERLDPASVAAAVARLDPATRPTCWQGTGGIERYPDTAALLDRLIGRPAAAVSGDAARALRLLRDPWRLSRCGTEPTVRVPPLRSLAHPPNDPPSNWLIKSTDSAGGEGIREGAAAEELPAECRGTSYLQRRVGGRDASIVLLADSGRIRWIGATYQWVGAAALGAGPFRYSASYGPILFERWRQAALLRFARRAVRDSGFDGILGIDLRLERRRTWVLEINPRYPAGAEVLERSAGRSLVAERMSVAAGGRFDWPEPTAESVRWAKGIRYLPSGVERQASGRGIAAALSSGPPGERPIADLPIAESRLIGPTPAFSIFACNPFLPRTVATLEGVAIVWETLIFETI